jgi:hypothetical protein
MTPAGHPPAEARIVYCNCSFARVLAPEVKTKVLEGLAASGRSFDAVPDLCEMSARKDPALLQISSGAVTIAACFPRAVRWLFSAAGAPLDSECSRILNMRTDSAEKVLESLLLDAGVSK